MHASAASCRRATRGTTWTLPWEPSDGSGQSWDSSSLQVLSRVRGLNRRAIAFSGRIPYFGGRFLTIEESSHAGSHGHGGTGSVGGRHPPGADPLRRPEQSGCQNDLVLLSLYPDQHTHVGRACGS